MTPQRQLVMKHDPANGQWGDCTRTAFAAILDMKAEDVPHFFHDGCEAEEADERIKTFLARHGYGIVDIPYLADPKTFMQTMKRFNPGVYYLLSVQSPISSHLIVCVDDEIACDPGQYSDGINAFTADPDGWVWVGIIVPLNQLRA